MEANPIITFPKGTQLLEAIKRTAKITSDSCAIFQFNDVRLYLEKGANVVDIVRAYTSATSVQI